MAARALRRLGKDALIVLLAALVVATLMAFVPALAREARAAGQPWSATTSAFVNCVPDATPQVCDPAHEQKVRVPRGLKIKVLRLKYTAASTHCSSGRLIIFLDGKRIARTEWVQAGQDSTVELLDLTLRRRAGGRAHQFTYKIEGQTGGCNVGSVISWAGDIKLTGKKKPL